jgi:hypothetical protein
MNAVDKIIDIVKSVTELNLRYTSTLLYLGKDYVKDINTVVTTNTRPRGPTGETPPPSRPQPLLIVGALDETVGAAFPLRNSSGRDVNVTLVVQGELGNGHVRVEPESLAIKQGESAIVRVIAHIDSKLDVGRDYAGAVAAPGLSAQFVEFVVRRLPDAADTSAESAEQSAGRSTRRRSTSRDEKA